MSNKVQQLIISTLTFGGMTEEKATLAAKILKRHLRLKS